jgi:hypothetical protein
MRRGGGHLTYCTNIHPGVTWPELREVLEGPVPAVRAAVAPGRPFGLGLRIAADAAETLAAAEATEELRALLAGQDLYLFTLNGFPYGAFHGTRVKERVYQPDWRHEARLAYTDRLADLLVRLLPDDPSIQGSISTVPGTFRPLAAEPGAVARMTGLYVHHAAHLIEIERRTGRAIALAIEPEPACFLETTDEAVAYFTDHLFGREARRLLVEVTGIAPGEAEAALRRHLGLCLDLCHAAVEFESPADMVRLIRSAGIAVPKLQVTAGLHLPRVDRAALERLATFDDGVYLHQVVERGSGGLVRYTDLPEALAAARGRDLGGIEWRVHFHVPVFHADLEGFTTTRGFLEDVLALHRAAPLSAHLEVETYTFDVLPEAYRAAGPVEAIVRELAWVSDRLPA